MNHRSLQQIHLHTTLMMRSWFWLTILVQLLFIGTTAFLVPTRNWQVQANRESTTITTSNGASSSSSCLEIGGKRRMSRTFMSLSSEAPNNNTITTEKHLETAEKDAAARNTVYIERLIENLTILLDKYIMNGSPKTRERAFNLLDQIAFQSKDDELVKKALRLVKRAGLPMEKTYQAKFSHLMTTDNNNNNNNKELGKTDSTQRQYEATERQKWEQQQQQINNQGGGKSALSRRMNGTSKPDVFLNNVLNPDSIATIANDKTNLQRELQANIDSNNNNNDGDVNEEVDEKYQAIISAAADKVSKQIAKAGAGSSFQGESLGIGGLDDVLAQIKRRVWTPLAAPPKLLRELGIHPVRGLLLYGKPGCGKTLLARTLGTILSPMRPITVVSGPEIMDKFVGSSEKNLREIFDNPPDIYAKYRLDEEDGGDAFAKAALHVVVMDEFDAVARTRGGRGGKGEQGDAGVARDSVVNQLLAKMDGVHPLPVPTLVIGLTNKRSLIEPALLRPGRFEVQVEVPPPRTLEQRISILKVHTKSMNHAGRVLVSDPPKGSAAASFVEKFGCGGILSYEDLLKELAQKCDGYSGAALAGVARAAASHALERAVNEFVLHVNEEETTTNGTTEEHSISDCLVTQDDFMEAVIDVLESMGDHDHSDEIEEDENDDEAETESRSDVGKEDEEIST